jgi:glucose/arabinose dehydrogenase
MRLLFEKHIISFFFLLFAISFRLHAQSLISIGSTQVRVDTLITGLDVPWETTYHNGSLWVTERKGIVSRIDTATGNKKVILRLTGQVIQQSESGLLGMALHPDFANVPEVFLAYTYSSGGFIRERIVKYRYENDSLLNPVILLNELPGNGTHNGCRLHFLSDTTLLASTGDVQNLTFPQDTSALSGKVLRMKTDGSPPADNPFPGSLVYSLGHRNVQGMATLPDGKIVLSEHGASTDDEVQLLWPGRNYGWPNVEGFCSTPTEISFCGTKQVVEPLKAYTPTIAPSDLAFYENPNFPEWNNRLLITILKNKQLRAIRLNETFDSVLTDIAYLSNRYGRLRDIAIGANKEIYLATNGASWANTDPNTHSIIRLRPIPQITSSKSLPGRQALMKLIPNPAANCVRISLTAENGRSGELQIFGPAGNLVYRCSTDGTDQILETSRIGKPGLYLVRFRNASGSLSICEKLLLQ